MGRRLDCGWGSTSSRLSSGLLAVGVLVAVLKPDVIREAGQAELLRPYAYGIAVVLLLGGGGGTLDCPRARTARGAPYGHQHGGRAVPDSRRGDSAD